MTIVLTLGPNAPNPVKLTLLQMIQQACGELGLIQPSTIFGNSDQQIVQLLSLAQREGYETYKMSTKDYGWQTLRAEYLFNVQSTGIQNVSYAQGSNLITWITPPAIQPAVGWVISNSGGSNATDFTYPTYVTAVLSSTQFTVSTTAENTNTSNSMAVGQEAYPLPTDYDHMIVQTQWDRGFRWQLLGPLNPQEWQVLKSGISPTGPRRRFRIMDNQFFIDPVPYDNNQLVFEYYSYNWCLNGQTNSAQFRWTSDTDTYLLDDDTFILGMIWRYRMAKGLDYSEECTMWQNSIARFKGRQSSVRNLPINAQQTGIRLISNAQVPDTGFGS
jgi:hypothetical protein